MFTHMSELFAGIHASRTRAARVLLAGGALAFALALPGSAASPSSGVSGLVRYGPTCPVQRVGQTCTRPYQATITVRREPGGRFIARVRSSTSGRFALRLPPGRYLLVPHSGAPYPRAASVTVVVRRHRYTAVTIDYDSGIR
jgi:hypothetical protein